MWYVDNFSLALDMKILFLTILRIILRKDVVVDQDVREIDDLGLHHEPGDLTPHIRTVERMRP